MRPAKRFRDASGQAKAGIVAGLDVRYPPLAGAGGQGYFFLAQFELFPAITDHFAEGGLRI